MKTIKTAIALALLLAVGLSQAQDGYDNPIIRTQITKQYAASAMLRKNDNPGTFKITQSVVKANSADEASGKFFSAIKKDMPGFSVMDSLITEIKNPKKECDTWL